MVRHPRGRDLNGDGALDLVVAAGVGGDPVVEVLNGTKALTTSGQFAGDYLVANFFGFDSQLRDGAYLAVGDVLGNGQQDLILGPGSGSTSEVEVISGMVGTGQNVPWMATVYAGSAIATTGSTSEPTGQLITPFGGTTLMDGVFVG